MGKKARKVRGKNDWEKPSKLQQHKQPVFGRSGRGNAAEKNDFSRFLPVFPVFHPRTFISLVACATQSECQMVSHAYDIEGSGGERKEEEGRE